MNIFATEGSKLKSAKRYEKISKNRINRITIKYMIIRISIDLTIVNDVYVWYSQYF